MPRGAYKGVVAVRNPLGARVFIAPTPEVDFSGEGGQEWQSFGGGEERRSLATRNGCVWRRRWHSQAVVFLLTPAAAAAAFDPNVKLRVDATGAVIRRRPRAPRKKPAQGQQQAAQAHGQQKAAPDAASQAAGGARQ